MTNSDGQVDKSMRLLGCRQIHIYNHDLLTICMSESLVLFDGEYYKQIDGVAMGSPLGPTFANIFFVFMNKFGLKIVPLNLNQ